MQSIFKNIFLAAASGSMVLFMACAPESKYGGGNGSLKNYESYESYHGYSDSYEEEYREPQNKPRQKETKQRVSEKQKSSSAPDRYREYQDDYYDSYPSTTHSKTNTVKETKPRHSSNTQAPQRQSERPPSTSGKTQQNYESPVKGDGSFKPTRSLLDGMRDSPAIQRATMRPYTIRGKTYYPHPVKVGDKFDGIASWYGPDFHAKPTSNGETYNMHAHTAAHKTLPINTIVKVYNKDNGRVTVVRINDRGPFVDGRIIDLSNVAAHDIDMVKKGIANVRIEVVGFGGDLQNNTPPSAPQRSAANTQSTAKDHRSSQPQRENNRTQQRTIYDNDERVREQGNNERLQREQEAREQALREEIQRLQAEKETREREIREQQERAEQERLENERKARERELKEQQEKEAKERARREQEEQENKERLQREQEAREQALKDEIERLKNEREEKDRQLRDEREARERELKERQEKERQAKSQELSPNLGMTEMELPQESQNLKRGAIQQPNNEEFQNNEEALEKAFTQIPPKRIDNGDSIRDIDKAVQKLKDSTQDLAQRARQENERKMKEEQERREQEEQENKERLQREQEAREQALKDEIERLKNEREEKDRQLREEQEKIRQEREEREAKERELREQQERLERERELKEQQEREAREQQAREEEQRIREQEAKELEEALAKEAQRQSTYNYMISLNVFSQEERALRFREENYDKVEGTSYVIEVVPTSKGLYRVALRGFSDVAEAKEFMAERGITGHVVGEEK